MSGAGTVNVPSSRHRRILRRWPSHTRSSAIEWCSPNHSSLDSCERHIIDWLRHGIARISVVREELRPGDLPGGEHGQDDEVGAPRGVPRGHRQPERLVAVVGGVGPRVQRPAVQPQQQVGQDLPLRGAQPIQQVAEEGHDRARARSAPRTTGAHAPGRRRSRRAANPPWPLHARPCRSGSGSPAGRRGIRRRWRGGTHRFAAGSRRGLRVTRGRRRTGRRPAELGSAQRAGRWAAWPPCCRAAPTGRHRGRSSDTHWLRRLNIANATTDNRSGFGLHRPLKIGVRQARGMLAYLAARELLQQPLVQLGLAELSGAAVAARCHRRRRGPA